MQFERRALGPVELRAKGRRLEGYAAVYGVEAKLPGFTEVLKPGCFASSLSERRDILALMDHDKTRVLARTKSGTLRISEDSRGLPFDLDVPQTTVGNDVLALAERGDLGGCSFAFTVPHGGERWDGDKRELRAVNLLEISIVSSWPAYEGTTVQARKRFDAPRLAIARRFMETVQ